MSITELTGSGLMPSGKERNNNQTEKKENIMTKKNCTITSLLPIWIFLLFVATAFAQTQQNPILEKKIEKTQPPMVYAAMRHQYDKVKQLLSKGDDPNTANQRNQTALMAAAGAGDIRIAALLVEKGADVNKTDDKGKTALVFAAMAGSKACAALLVEHGAGINIPDHLGWTPLMHAVMRNRTDTVSTFIDLDAGLDFQDTSGMTALMWGALTQSTESVRLLIKAGADKGIRSKGGLSVYDYAKGKKEIMDLLKSGGGTS